MELGGNAPFLVFADADLDAAVAGALVAKLRHNGETCTAANRFFVEAPVAHEFGRRLAEAMGSLTVGPGLDPATQLGPLVDAPGREKVERLVQVGGDGGARVLTGGGRPSRLPRGYYHEYTVITPGASNRSTRRVITGGAPVTGQSQYFYTADHYETFCLVSGAGGEPRDGGTTAGAEPHPRG